MINGLAGGSFRLTDVTSTPVSGARIFSASGEGHGRNEGAAGRERDSSLEEVAAQRRAVVGLPAPTIASI
jgi:hypothetical protein